MFRDRAPWFSSSRAASYAGVLAGIGGFVNVSGFMLLTAFTSHMTGNVALVVIGLTNFEIASALSALAIIAAFVAGSAIASVLLRGTSKNHPGSYLYALGIEATLLLMVAVLGASLSSQSTVQASALAAAMGLQNGWCTQVSRSGVRTTHLTGILTDLGIELASWLLNSLHASTEPAEALPDAVFATNQSRPRTLMMTTLGFVAGGATGAFAARNVGHLALLIPAIALVILGAIIVKEARATVVNRT